MPKVQPTDILSDFSDFENETDAFDEDTDTSFEDDSNERLALQKSIDAARARLGLGKSASDEDEDSDEELAKAINADDDDDEDEDSDEDDDSDEDEDDEDSDEDDDSDEDEDEDSDEDDADSDEDEDEDEDEEDDEPLPARNLGKSLGYAQDAFYEQDEEGEDGEDVAPYEDAAPYLRGIEAFNQTTDARLTRMEKSLAKQARTDTDARLNRIEGLLSLIVAQGENLAKSVDTQQEDLEEVRREMGEQKELHKSIADTVEGIAQTPYGTPTLSGVGRPMRGGVLNKGLDGAVTDALESSSPFTSPKFLGLTEDDFIVGLGTYIRENPSTEIDLQKSIGQNPSDRDRKLYTFAYDGLGRTPEFDLNG